MNLRINITFYLSSGHIIKEYLEYKKRDEKVAFSVFQQEVENVEKKIREELDTGISVRNGEVFRINNTCVRIYEIVAYESFIEEVNVEQNIKDNEETDILQIDS